MFELIKRVFGLDPNGRALKRYMESVESVNILEPEMQSMSDDDIRERAKNFRSRIDNGESIDSLMPEVFAAVRESSARTIGLRHYDVQLVGGMALHEGNIAEMKTGEGKTLVATLAIVLNALGGKGAHLVTVNDYLSKRDAEWMGPIYNMMGLSVGVIYPFMPQEEREAAYRADITYGTNSEFGFDYLRDNMVLTTADMSQRGHNYCIVDEVDSILIDEARTPLIISGPSDDNVELYKTAEQIARQLKETDDYEKDEKERNITLTEGGITKAEKLMKMPGLFSDAAHSELAHRIVQAVKAHKLFQRDVQYVVKDGEIIIVDEFTGRLMVGRRYSDGLHQAIEAKERVKVGRESQTLATITLQNYFRMYSKLAGMTGTALTEAEEFNEIYGLKVITVPTHREMIRLDHPDAIYGSALEKYSAVADEVCEKHSRGQPVLVGTTSIENSERVSKLLKARKIEHQVLNAKQHEKEALIVAQAGRMGAVTVATNMAGRGTDIVLGGQPYSDEEHDKVTELGGLAIVGTERHESRRIDNQLRGRSGRQGDPGESRFYLSLEDDLLRLFGSEKIQGLMGKLGMENGESINSPMLTKVIESSQKKVEQMHFDIRKQLLAYDNVMNQQREAVYTERQNILTDENVTEYGLGIVEGVISDIIEQYFQENEDPDTERAVSKARAVFGPEVAAEFEGVDSLGGVELLRDDISKAVKSKYESKVKEFGEELAPRLIRYILLNTLDSNWRDHLLGMDELRRGIGLRAIGQKDPLLEYQFESYNLFQDMMRRTRLSITEQIFRVKIVSEDAHRDRHYSEGRDFNMPLIPRKSEAYETALHAGEGKQAPVRKGVRVGRNDPCPCGSGRKYKHCCGK
ncbi:MAG: preprotein translocase subunit SecA [Synergistaceae bacterium]|nr:preprotein translocase subunit SecA [Synergistaceae bacterium]